MPLRRGSDGRLGVSLHGTAERRALDPQAAARSTLTVAFKVLSGRHVADGCRGDRALGPQTMIQVAQEEIRHATRSRGHLNRG
ncbi:hypothetical protein ABIC03_003453 [Bradyrhizobium sp. RT6a]